MHQACWKVENIQKNCDTGLGALWPLCPPPIWVCHCWQLWLTHLDDSSWFVVSYVYSRTISKHEYSWIRLGINISVDARDGSTVTVVSMEHFPATTQWVSATFHSISCILH